VGRVLSQQAAAVVDCSYFILVRRHALFSTPPGMLRFGHLQCQEIPDLSLLVKCVVEIDGAVAL